MLNRHNLVETQEKDLELTLGKSEVSSSFNSVRPTFKNIFPNLTRVRTEIIRFGCVSVQ